MRTVKEQMEYTKKDLENMAMTFARMAIVGGFYKGEIGPQNVEWMDDGGVLVVTEHTPE